MPKWLKCKIAKGMFSDEYTVIVRTRSGEDVAVFVPKDYAREDDGKVKVRVSEQEGLAIAVLPDANQSVVDVESSELMPA
jgi:hypothetical protein